MVRLKRQSGVIIILLLLFSCATFTMEQKYYSMKIHYKNLQERAISAIERGELDKYEMELIQDIDSNIVDTIRSIESGNRLLREEISNLAIQMKRLEEVLNGPNNSDLHSESY